MCKSSSTRVHAEFNIEFENDYEIDEVRKLLNDADGCTVHDEQKDGDINQLKLKVKMRRSYQE